MGKWPTPQPNMNQRRPFSVAGVLALFILCVAVAWLAVWTVGSVLIRVIENLHWRTV